MCRGLSENYIEIDDGMYLVILIAVEKEGSYGSAARKLNIKSSANIRRLIDGDTTHIIKEKYNLLKAGL